MNFDLFYEWVLGKTKEIPRKGTLPLSANSGLNSSFYVVRNAAFEPFIPYIERALAGFGIRVSWRLSKYSDQFSDLSMSTDDIVIYFVDPAGKNWKLQQKFLNEAIISALSISINPVTVVILGSKEEYETSEVFLGELQVKVKFIYILGGKEDERAFTSRLSGVTGLNIDPDKIIEGGLDLVFEALLACIFQRPKILVLDLDNTLYDGVLGEQSIHSLMRNSSQANLIESVMKFRSTKILNK